MNSIKLVLGLALLSLLAACKPNLQSNSYDYYGGMGGNVQAGVIQDIQYNVKVDKNTGVGSLAGGVAGGAVGSSIGGGFVSSILGAVGGAVVGGIAGNAIENGVSDTTSTLYIIQVNNNKYVSVIQDSAAPLCVGDHVFIIGSGDRPHLKINDGYYADGKHTRPGCSSVKN
jgi:outer membrane lipoprotein SlyB